MLKAVAGSYRLDLNLHQTRSLAQQYQMLLLRTALGIPSFVSNTQTARSQVCCAGQRWQLVLHQDVRALVWCALPSLAKGHTHTRRASPMQLAQHDVACSAYINATRQSCSGLVNCTRQPAAAACSQRWPLPLPCLSHGPSLTEHDRPELAKQTCACACRALQTSG